MLFLYQCRQLIQVDVDHQYTDFNARKQIFFYNSLAISNFRLKNHHFTSISDIKMS
jgi:hypothetical protein